MHGSLIPGPSARLYRGETPNLLAGKELRVSPAEVRPEKKPWRWDGVGRAMRTAGLISEKLKRFQLAPVPSEPMLAETLKMPAFNKLSLQKLIIFIVVCP